MIEKIQKALDGDDYERGELESLKCQVQNNSQFIAMLTERLVKSGLLTTVEVDELIEGVRF